MDDATEGIGRIIFWLVIGVGIGVEVIRRWARRRRRVSRRRRWRRSSAWTRGPVYRRGWRGTRRRDAGPGAGVRRRGGGVPVEPVAPVERIALGGLNLAVPDGDGLTFAEPDGEGNRVRLRLWGIDAPEFPRQPLGFEAREQLIALIAAPGGVRRKGRNVEVTVKAGVTARVHRVGIKGEVKESDKYGRTLVSLHDAEGRCINEAMVASGFAWRYFDDGAYSEAQRKAEAAMVGVHKPGMESVKPWDWRKLYPPKERGQRTPTPAARPGWWPWAVAALILLALLALAAVEMARSAR